MWVHLKKKSLEYTVYFSREDFICTSKNFLIDMLMLTSPLHPHEICTQIVDLHLFCFFIGKVAVKKEDLSKYTGKETWFMLQSIDSNSEVQVKLKKMW